MADRYIRYQGTEALTTDRYIELMAAAYCKVTAIPPEEATLVVETIFDKDVTKMIYRICRREERSMIEARAEKNIRKNRLLLACIKAAGFEPWTNIDGEVGLRDADGTILTGHPIDDED